MCDAATKKTREIDRKRWLKLHAYIANASTGRSLSLNDLKDADEFFECLAGGDDTVDADELESAAARRARRDEFITLLFDAEMSQRFFDAARSGDKRSTMLTVPLWSLTYQRKKKLQGCYEDFYGAGDQAAASPKRETVEGVVAIESPGGRRTSRRAGRPRGARGRRAGRRGGRSSAEVGTLEHHQRIRGTNTLKEGPKAGGDDDDDDSARSAGRRPSRAAGIRRARASRARGRVRVDADTQDAYRDDNDVFVDTYSTARVRKGHRARGVVDLGTQKEGPKRGPKKAAKTREQIAGRRGGGLFAGKAVGVVVGSAGGGKLAGTGQMVGPGAFRRAGGVRGGLSS
ncbi:hypothetical protein SO694_00007527 [Aureococcus anophagefferens]|uniref:Uncharacterized protein n=1 Tax=Aureococcus anophagefferens TaxID=44056 RepID=A0ABR1GBH8_AURAN